MITIVTASLNALRLLRYTAKSLLVQSSRDWEWIVIDGASSDGTADWLAVLAGRMPERVQFISEPDGGIYEAMNKALPLIRGDWVIFFGAGDRFIDSNILTLAISGLIAVPRETNIAWGKVEYVKTPEQTAGHLSPEGWEGIDGTWSWCHPRLPCHQGTFFRTKLFKHGGRYDTSYRIASDAAFMLKEMVDNGAFSMNIKIALVLSGGISQSSIHRRLMLNEFLRANRHAGLGWTRVGYQYTAYAYHLTKLYWSIVKVRFCGSV